MINKKYVAKLIILMTLILVFSSISSAAEYKTLLMQDEMDCDNYCVGIGHPEGDCRSSWEPIEATCIGYTNWNPEGDIGSCSDTFLSSLGGDVSCICCYNPYFPACNRGAPIWTYVSWSVADDCWSYSGLCSLGSAGCKGCDFGAGDGGLIPVEDSITIPKGDWKITATMSNIRSYVTCEAAGFWECVGIDCFSKVVDARFELILDGTSIASGSRTATAFVEYDAAFIGFGGDAPKDSGTASDILLEPQISCTNNAGCNLVVRRQFGYQGATHKTLWGGSGNYYYGDVKADVSVSWGPGCDSTSCATPGDWDCDFNAGDTMRNMCGDDQYYWYTSGAKELVTWTVTPTSDYDLYANWGIGDSPTLSDYDCRPYKYGSNQEVCTSCLESAGTRHALVHKFYGSGSYDISLSASDVECCGNDRADGTSTECFNRLGFPNQYLKCESNVCQPGPCSENSNCGDGFCCDRSPDIIPTSLWGAGQCQPLGNIKQPYLCAS